MRRERGEYAAAGSSRESRARTDFDDLHPAGVVAFPDRGDPSSSPDPSIDPAPQATGLLDETPPDAQMVTPGQSRMLHAAAAALHCWP
jgi:hypothetical protein